MSVLLYGGETWNIAVEAFGSFVSVSHELSEDVLPPFCARAARDFAALQPVA